MTISEKILRAKADFDEVYAKGVADGKLQGDGGDDNYEAGRQAEYDAFWDTYQQNGKLTNYSNSFAGFGWNSETFKPKYDMKPTAAYMMFRQVAANSPLFDLVEHLNNLGVYLDFSECTSFNYAFYNARFTHLGVIDVRKANSITTCFESCYAETIDELILKEDGTTTIGTAFKNCGSLKNIKISGKIGVDADFSSCYSLSHDSLISIINALKDFSGTSTTRTLTLHTDAKAKLTEVEMAIATEKGWTVA